MRTNMPASAAGSAVAITQQFVATLAEDQCLRLGGQIAELGPSLGERLLLQGARSALGPRLDEVHPSSSVRFRDLAPQLE
jgi:hypothetical protein